VDYVLLRDSLDQFATEMEKVLRKHDHKRAWRELPIEALIRKLMIEIEEFKVAHEFFHVQDTRNELVDVANFALILWDRLSLLDQDKTEQEQLSTTAGAQ
jgi:hypothetical protein